MQHRCDVPALKHTWFGVVFPTESQPTMREPVCVGVSCCGFKKRAFNIFFGADPEYLDTVFMKCHGASQLSGVVERVLDVKLYIV